MQGPYTCRSGGQQLSNCVSARRGPELLLSQIALPAQEGTKSLRRLGVWGNLCRRAQVDRLASSDPHSLLKGEVPNGDAAAPDREVIPFISAVPPSSSRTVMVMLPSSINVARSCRHHSRSMRLACARFMRLARSSAASWCLLPSRPSVAWTTPPAASRSPMTTTMLALTLRASRIPSHTAAGACVPRLLALGAWAPAERRAGRRPSVSIGVGAPTVELGGRSVRGLESGDGLTCALA